MTSSPLRLSSGTVNTRVTRPEKFPYFLLSLKVLHFYPCRWRKMGRLAPVPGRPRTHTYPIKTLYLATRTTRDTKKEWTSGEDESGDPEDPSDEVPSPLGLSRFLSFPLRVKNSKFSDVENLVWFTRTRICFLTYLNHYSDSLQRYDLWRVLGPDPRHTRSPLPLCYSHFPVVPVLLPGFPFSWCLCSRSFLDLFRTIHVLPCRSIEKDGSRFTEL